MLIIQIYVFIIGLCIGSFINVLVYRLPRDISIISPSSRCPSCGGRIRFFDNIPVISWLLLGGKCRLCGERISAMYPVTELLAGVLFWCSYLRFDLSAEFALAALLISTGIAAGFSDLFSALDTENFECGIIPDSIIVFGLLSAFTVTYIIKGTLLFSLYGAGLAFLALYVPSALYKLMRGRDGMGFGDIKLITVFGAFLGMKSVFFLVFGSALMGAVVGIGWQVASGRKNMMMPFGPFISAAAIIYLFFETRLDSLLYRI